MKKRVLTDIIFVLFIPLLCVAGLVFFKSRFYSFVTGGCVLLCVVGFMLHFEKQDKKAVTVAIVACMTALSVVGRIAFAFLPGIKPCTAFVIITALYLGREAGFVTGAMTALVSNFYYGQGAWTPFQMLVWGFIGFFAGVLAKPLKSKRIALVIYSVLSGIAFSLIMDLWSAVWADNAFVLSRYLALIASSLWFTVMYAVSNVIFILLLEKPLGRIFRRLNRKYGIS